MLTPGSKIRPRPPKSDPRYEKTNDARRKNQTEPYSASYGRKPFWGVPLKFLAYAKGDLGDTFQNPDIFKGNWGNLQAIWTLSEWYPGASWSSWVPGVAK